MRYCTLQTDWTWARMMEGRGILRNPCLLHTPLRLPHFLTVGLDPSSGYLQKGRVAGRSPQEELQRDPQYPQWYCAAAEEIPGYTGEVLRIPKVCIKSDMTVSAGRKAQHIRVSHHIASVYMQSNQKIWLIMTIKTGHTGQVRTTVLKMV